MNLEYVQVLVENGECERLWNTLAKSSDIGIGTLERHAQQDNPLQYKEIMNLRKARSFEKIYELQDDTQEVTIKYTERGIKLLL